MDRTQLHRQRDGQGDSNVPPELNLQGGGGEKDGIVQE